MNIGPKSLLVLALTPIACITAQGDAGSVLDAASGDGASGGDATDEDGVGGDDGGATGGADDGDADDGDADGGDADGGATEDDGGGDIRYDVGDDGTGGAGDDGGCDPETDPDCACTAVDLLFIIDASASMAPCADALAEAFPTFADAIVQELPVATSLHVGVTGAEMGISYSGSLDGCTGIGKEGAPASDFYVTPDVENTGEDGAQGRLFEALGRYYFDVDTDAPQAEIDALGEWFGEASKVARSLNSQVEMSAGPAGWAFHEANEPTNAGFLRDEDAVLVLFVLQDEPDQTPMFAAQDIVDMIDAAKRRCGGMDCVVGGGGVNVGCLPEVPLGVLFDSLGAEPVVDQLPDCDDITPEYFRKMLVDTLAQVIAQKCENMPEPVP
jgi:hypothetical protein